MRLFIGIAASAAVIENASNLIDELRRRVARLAPAARVTWVAPERLHLTVRFIGEVDEVRAASLRDVLQAPLGMPPFDVTFAAPAAFVRRGAPQVIHTAVARNEERLKLVEREVTARLASVAVPPEDRPYSPHLTLARVREPAGLKAAALFNGLSTLSPGSQRVEAITLYESRLSPRGPTYMPLMVTALGEG